MWLGLLVGEGSNSTVGKLLGATEGGSVDGMSVLVGTGGCVAGPVGGMAVSVGAAGCVAGPVGGMAVSVGAAGCVVGSEAADVTAPG